MSDTVVRIRSALNGWVLELQSDEEQPDKIGRAHV